MTAVCVSQTAYGMTRHHPGCSSIQDYPDLLYRPSITSILQFHCMHLFHNKFHITV